MRLDKAAHIANILAVIPAGFCAYVSWVLLHAQQAPSSGSELLSNRLVWLAVGAFFGLFTLGAVLSIAALAHKRADLTASSMAAPLEKEKGAKEVENLVAHSAALNKELDTVRDKLKDCEEKRQMPRPYLDVADSNQSMFRQTSFTLTNRGGDVAHNIRVLPVIVHHRNLTFEPIPILAVGAEKKAAGTISGMGIMQDRDVLSLMVSEWNGTFEGGGLVSLEVSEWVKEIKIEYEDFTGKKFEMTCELVVFPIAKTLADKHSNDEWPKHEYKTVEVRNFKFVSL